MAIVRKLPIIAVLALLLVVPAARASLPPGYIGVSPQSQANHRDFQLMREAGVSSVRLPLFWSAIEPESPLAAEPDWTAFDHEVEMAAEEGIRIMPFISATPDWVAADPKALPVKSSWQRWAWGNFLRAAVRRYGPGGVFWKEHQDLAWLPFRRWEIWNEENIVSFVDRPDPIGFATLIRISGRVLHGADPGSRVIVGGLFGRPLQIPPNAGSGDFLSRLYRAGNVRPYFDGVALHPYVADVRAMGAQLENLRRIMRIHGDAATPLYVTELGWGSRSGPTRWERGLYGQANNLSRAFSMLSANRLRWRVGGVWWFTWSDEGGSCQFCHSAGLLTEKRLAKPAWYRFNAWTGGDPDIVENSLYASEPDIVENTVPGG
jgi:hypothetical protein